MTFFRLLQLRGHPGKAMLLEINFLRNALAGSGEANEVRSAFEPTLRSLVVGLLN